MTDDAEDQDTESRRLVTQQSIDASNRPSTAPLPAYAERAEIMLALRELRGELAGIRTRLDSLVGIEKQLGYQGQRLAAIERRFATLVETKLEPQASPAAALYAFMGWLTSRKEESGPFSATLDAAPAAELVGAFCRSQGYADLPDGWEKSLRPYPATPP